MTYKKFMSRWGLITVSSMCLFLLIEIGVETFVLLVPSSPIRGVSDNYHVAALILSLILGFVFSCLWRWDSNGYGEDD